jgi:anti-sigma factor RsiW
MTTHLSPDDLAAAVDGTLETAGAAHIDRCPECRAAVSEWSALLTALKSDAVPEPSPLFWDQFSARVGEATANVSPPQRRAWTFGRPVLAFGALAAAALVLLVWSTSLRDRAAPRPPALATATTEVPADADVAWQAMSEMAASMTADDVRRATAPAPERTSLLSELSDDERAVFVELLKREIGEVQ